MTDTKTRAEVRRLVAEFIARHPELTYKDIGKRMGCSAGTVQLIAKEHGTVRRARVDVQHLKALEETYAGRE